MNQHGITHSARIKTYPDGTVDVLIASSPIFRESGWEERKKGKGRKPVAVIDCEASDIMEMSMYAMEREEERAAAAAVDSVQRAKRRARNMVHDYAMSTPFKYFVTLTLNGDKVDRYDMAAVTKALNQWADNQVRRKGLAYVLVPELHRDGAVHFHGFFNDALPVVDSGTMIPPGGGKPKRPRSKAQRDAWVTEGGRIVYNLPGWTLGFTTAIALYGERSAAVGYVCKYISKAQTKVGGRWYYSGGDLKLPDVLLADLNLEEVKEQYGSQCHEFEVQSLAGVRFCAVRLKGETNESVCN